MVEEAGQGVAMEFFLTIMLNYEALPDLRRGVGREGSRAVLPACSALPAISGLFSRGLLSSAGLSSASACRR